MLEQLS